MSSLIGGPSTLMTTGTPVASAEADSPKLESKGLPPTDQKVTIERKGNVCLIGLSRPDVRNRVGPVVRPAPPPIAVDLTPRPIETHVQVTVSYAIAP